MKKNLGTSTSDFSAAVPAPELWQAPMSWAGSPPKPVPNYSRSFPNDAVFVRAEVIVEILTAIKPGVDNVSEDVRPALLRLSGGKPIEILFAGFDGRCWTLRDSKVGRRRRWLILVGPAFPAQEPAPPELLERFRFQRILVQSLLPAEATGKYLSFAITDLYGTEKFDDSDPDPND